MTVKCFSSLGCFDFPAQGWLVQDCFPPQQEAIFSKNALVYKPAVHQQLSTKQLTDKVRDQLLNILDDSAADLLFDCK